jgi:hypothetical protein
MIDMHVSLPDLKYRSPPLWWFIVLGSLCLHSKAFFVLSMHWLIHVLAIHSAVSAVPILGCLRRLLLLLLVKLDYAPKCGVVWFIMKNFLSWILLRVILWLIVCIMPTHQGGQPVMNLPPVETILFKYMLSSTFLETAKSSRHASHNLP